MKQRSATGVVALLAAPDISESIGSDPIVRDWEWKAKRSEVSVRNQADWPGRENTPSWKTLRGNHIADASGSSAQFDPPVS